jgi:hypothetical protein
MLCLGRFDLFGLFNIFGLFDMLNVLDMLNIFDLVIALASGPMEIREGSIGIEIRIGLGEESKISWLGEVQANGIYLRY